jgi:hypothetical protein
MERKKMGYRRDFILRESNANHDVQCEYGAGEVGTTYEDKQTKHLIEGEVKLPKVLKNMLDAQILTKGCHVGLKVFGILHSGLNDIFPIL